MDQQAVHLGAGDAGIRHGVDRDAAEQVEVRLVPTEALWHPLRETYDGRDTPQRHQVEPSPPNTDNPNERTALRPRTLARASSRSPPI
jgi:hypothetical protein